jgi:NAD(P)-dependent dehydrogenase (short-subunit alcohol dehydrogenase family)
MDFGIAGRWALVCAASKGLGKGCAAALVREGVNVVITARGDAALQATAAAQPLPRPLLAAHTRAHLPAIPRSMSCSCLAKVWPW